LSHSKWQCKYHVVLIPKYRKEKLYGAVKRRLGEVFHRLAQQKDCWIGEGHLMPDHVHMLINVPPKLAVSSVVGYIKGKSAIHVARHCLKRERNYAGQHLWARGFYVDPGGRNTELIRKYIQEQELADRRLEQMEMPEPSKE
jgi:putative transposase